jgi:hypothetical protein
MYLLHRKHTDISTSKLVYQCFEGTKIANSPISSIKAAEIRRSELLWSAISQAQNDLRPYRVEGESVVIDYGNITVSIQVDILKCQNV